MARQSALRPRELAVGTGATIIYGHDRKQMAKLPCSPVPYK